MFGLLNRPAFRAGFFCLVAEASPLSPPPLRGRPQGRHHPQDYYARSIDEIEDITGINFLSSLPDAEEMDVESTFDTKYWK